mgnify:CR=1 FL=1
MRKELLKRDIREHEMTMKEKEELASEVFQSLTIQDDFMFASVMKDKAICLKVLNILLKDYFEIGSIELTTPEATIKNHPELKFVRLDVLATDEAGNSYDIEMQVINRKNIEKRMRAYQVAIDMFKMQKGKAYNALTNTIIIFITPFDPFGAGLPVYFFDKCARGNSSIKLDDGVYKVVFNTKAFEDAEDEMLKDILRFFHTGKATCAVAKEMEMKIEAIKSDSMIFAEFFPAIAQLIDARDDGEEEGIAKGIEKGRKEGIEEGIEKRNIELAKFFRDSGVSLDKIAEATGLTEKEIEKL